MRRTRRDVVGGTAGLVAVMAGCGRANTKPVADLSVVNQRSVATSVRLLVTDRPSGRELVRDSFRLPGDTGDGDTSRTYDDLDSENSIRAVVSTDSVGEASHEWQNANGDAGGMTVSITDDGVTFQGVTR